MSTISSQIIRVSNLLQTAASTQAIDQTQQQLLQIQNELSTGKQVNQPSDNPSAAAGGRTMSTRRPANWARSIRR
jgi:flagellin-like hook-associated protein FlgL